MPKKTNDKTREEWEKLLEKVDESLKKPVPESKVVQAQLSSTARIIVQEYEQETGEKLTA